MGANKEIIRIVLVRVLIAVIVIGVILIFPQTVRAAEEMGYDIKSVYYFAFDGDGNEYLDSIEVRFLGTFTSEQKAFVLFSMLFEDSHERVRFIPEDTRVIYVKIVGETVVVNVSGELLKYGGTANETALVRQILMTAASVDDIKFITLLIGYNSDVCLPEGTVIENYRLFGECTD